MLLEERSGFYHATEKSFGGRGRGSFRVLEKYISFFLQSLSKRFICDFLCQICLSTQFPCSNKGSLIGTHGHFFEKFDLLGLKMHVKISIPNPHLSHMRRQFFVQKTKFVCQKVENPTICDRLQGVHARTTVTVHKYKSFN